MQASLESFYYRLLHDLTLEIAHLTQVIKSSQARKDMLTLLVSDMKNHAARIHVPQGGRMADDDGSIDGDISGKPTDEEVSGGPNATLSSEPGTGVGSTSCGVAALP